MMDNATYRVSLDDAMRSVTAKLQAVRNSLTPEERAVMTDAFSATAAEEDAGGDLSGYLLPGGLAPVITAGVA